MTSISSTINLTNPPSTGFHLSSPRSGSSSLTSVELAKVVPTADKIEIESVQTSQAAPTKVSPSNENLSKLLLEMQVKMNKLNPELAFSVDQASGRTVIQLTDRITNEVIQQFPSEAALQISKALDRFQKGQLLNLQA